MGKVLPVEKKLTALEEAEYEQEDYGSSPAEGYGNGFGAREKYKNGGEEEVEREMGMQCRFFSPISQTDANAASSDNSHGDFTNPPTPDGLAWSRWYGSKLRRGCAFAASGGISYPKFGVGYFDG